MEYNPYSDIYFTFQSLFQLKFTMTWYRAAAWWEVAPDGY